MWDDPDTIFEVVVNHEEQYSIWPTGREVPAGWSTVGVSGTKEHCLEHIEAVWTDMRPLSLRLAMQADAATQAVQEATTEHSVTAGSLAAAGSTATADLVAATATGPTTEATLAAPTAAEPAEPAPPEQPR